MRMDWDLKDFISRKQSLNDLTKRWDPQLGDEIIPIDQASGRVLAEDVFSDVTLPVVRSSRCDGIAVHSKDFREGVPDTTGWIRDIDYAQADTGDDFSDEFDAVVAIENVQRNDDGSVEIINRDISVRPGDAINEAGSIVKEGQTLLRKGRILDPHLIAVLAIAGKAQVSVMRKPTVAFIPTGSELIPFGSVPGRGQNIDANSLMFRAMASGWGAVPFTYPIVKDKPNDLEKYLDLALEAADIVVINGGSSKGEEDYNTKLLEKRGTYFNHGVRMIPGKPMGSAIIDGKPVVNSPGPVIACFFCLDWLIKGLVYYSLGAKVPKRPTVTASLAKGLSKPKGFERLYWVTLYEDEGELMAMPIEGYGAPAQLSMADGLFFSCAEASKIPSGEKVEIELLRPRN